MNQDHALEFGNRLQGQHYHPRPGSYAVIFTDDGQVAVMRGSQGDFLPGGGAEPGESLEATLRREIMEECGCEVEILRPLGCRRRIYFSQEWQVSCKTMLVLRCQAGGACDDARGG